MKTVYVALLGKIRIILLMLDVEISRHQTRALRTVTLCTLVISVGHDLLVDTVSHFRRHE